MLVSVAGMEVPRPTLTLDRREKSWSGGSEWRISVEGIPLLWPWTEDLGRAFIERFEPTTVGVAIRNEKRLTRSQALIYAGDRRIARIPPPLWDSYDATIVYTGHHGLRLLSMKARALFPDQQDVLVRVTL